MPKIRTTNTTELLLTGNSLPKRYVSKKELNIIWLQYKIQNSNLGVLALRIPPNPDHKPSNYQ
jgi:hypothetical protein